MATRRKVRDEHEARGLLDAMDDSGLSLPEFCAHAGVDGRSLNCWRVNLERRAAPENPPSSPVSIRFLEVVGARQPAPRPVYRVCVGELVIEVDDDFQEGTLDRLLRVAASW